MNTKKVLRKEGYIREAAAAFIALNSNHTSLITVTRAEISDSERVVKIFVSVFPEAKEGEALDFLKRQRGEFREMLQKNLHLNPLPFVDFLIDWGDKNRLNIENVSKDSHRPKEAN